MEFIGHRGASFDAPENTLAAVRRAWRQGVDAVEIDVHLSSDGRIVAVHDATTLRTAGLDRPVLGQTLAELKALDTGRWKGAHWTGERIAALREVLATVPDGRRLFVEIKSGPEIIPELVRVLGRARLRASQVVPIGFSLETMREIKDALPRHHVYWVVKLASAGEGTYGPPAAELVEQARAASLDGLDVGNAPLVDRSYVEEVKRAGLGFYVWTVNTLEAARWLHAAGADGVASDRPAWLRRTADGPPPKP